MGTCISKCSSSSSCLNNSSSSSHNINPQDKLVITQFPPPLPAINNSSSSNSTHTFSTTSTCSSSSSSSSTSYQKHFYSNDLLLSCANKQNPHIIILNPHKYDAAETKLLNNNSSTLRPLPMQPKLQQSVRLPSPSRRKRPRSPQPPIARQKSFKSDDNYRGATPTLVVNPTRKVGYNSNINRIIKNHDLRTSVGGGISKKVQPLSPCNSISRSRSRSRSRPNLKESSGSRTNCLAVAEDIDNPLISMECFIFL